LQSSTLEQLRSPFPPGCSPRCWCARIQFGQQLSGLAIAAALVSIPTGALGDDPERPRLRFTEHACVQCGLCKATCSEKVITLKPQLDFRAATAMSRVLKEEEPFHCIRCGKPFGVKSTIERVIDKLAGRHWMYAEGSKRLDAAPSDPVRKRPRMNCG
jgi:ferredoxin